MEVTLALWLLIGLIILGGVAGFLVGYFFGATKYRDDESDEDYYYFHNDDDDDRDSN